MASIKRSELESLKKDANAFHFAGEVNRILELIEDVDAWKVRTWRAEQEIHDLKEQAEHNDDLHDEALAYWSNQTKEWEEYAQKCDLLRWDVEVRYEELQKRYSELLAQQVVHQVNESESKPINIKELASAVEDIPTWRSYSDGITTTKPHWLRRHFSRIAISLLLLAVIGFGLISYRQNQVIQYQRQVLYEAVQYILQECPPASSDSLSRAQQ